MPTAAETHDAMVAAYNEQRRRVLGQDPAADIWTGRTAARFRDDPRRPLDQTLESILAYVRPADIVVDVGGGAGRLGLPIALRCRELINVDPSQGMREAFEAIVAESAVTNARYVQTEWLAAAGIEGDVVLVAHVTYFVPRIEPFLAKVRGAARRRVVMMVNTVPPPNSTAQMFEVVYGEPQALVPAHEELIAALEQAGLKPDVTLLDTPRGERAGAFAVLPSREQAVEAALIGPWMRPGEEQRIRQRVHAHFDDLFAAVEGGYIRRLSRESRPVLITWEEHSVA